MSTAFKTVERVSKVALKPGECLGSYDVTALFTSVPMDPTLNIIQGLLGQDTSLFNRTVLSVQNIIQLLGFCLYNMYFSFQGQFYKEVERATMGSQASPILTNWLMEHFERTALSAATTPRLWLRYVHGTFVIQQEEHKQNFLEHINNVDHTSKVCTIPFLDTVVKPEPDNNLPLSIGNLCILTNTLSGPATII